MFCIWDMQLRRSPSLWSSGTKAPLDSQGRKGAWGPWGSSPSKVRTGVRTWDSGLGPQPSLPAPSAPCLRDRGFLVAQRVKPLSATGETQVRSLGQKDTLEKEMATPSSILAKNLLLDGGAW